MSYAPEQTAASSVMRFLESQRAKYHEMLRSGDAADSKRRRHRRPTKVRCPKRRAAILREILDRKLGEGMSWDAAAEGTPFTGQDARQMATVRGLYDPSEHRKQAERKRARLQAAARRVYARAVELGSVTAALAEQTEITDDQFYRERARIGLPSLKQNQTNSTT